MANDKLISPISTIQRALGMIEGVSYGMEQSPGQVLADAVQMIDETILDPRDFYDLCKLVDMVREEKGS